MEGLLSKAETKRKVSDVDRNSQRNEAEGASLFDQRSTGMS